MRPTGEVRDGRLLEPVGTGFVALIAPAFAVAGATGVSLFLAAVGALAMALGYRLALRVVPDPWAVGAAAAVGLSPPVLVHATAVLPELMAGACLAGGGAAGAAPGGPHLAGARPSCCSRCSGSCPGWG